MIPLYSQKIRQAGEEKLRAETKLYLEQVLESHGVTAAAAQAMIASCLRLSGRVAEHP